MESIWARKSEIFEIGNDLEGKGEKKKKSGQTKQELTKLEGWRSFTARVWLRRRYLTFSE